MTRLERPLKGLLRPARRADPRWAAASVLPLLVASAALVLVAAIAMPTGYSWRILSISESAAQGQNNAWIARLAFICFGSAVLALSFAMRSRWARVTYWMNLAFAAFMLGAASFSHKPWLPGIPYDEFEDVLHSVCATGMGFAFCAAVVARFFQRSNHDQAGRVLDVLALVAAITLPLVLGSSSNSGGLMQRVMFAIAYVWFGREALVAFNRANEHDNA